MVRQAGCAGGCQGLRKAELCFYDHHHGLRHKVFGYTRGALSMWFTAAMFLASPGEPSLGLVPGCIGRTPGEVSTVRDSYPTATTLQIVYLSALAIGTNIGQARLVINGSIVAAISFTSTSGTTTVNGITNSVDSKVLGTNVPSQPRTGDPDDNNVYRGGELLISSSTFARNVDPNAPDPPEVIEDTGISKWFPNRSSFTSLGVGAVGRVLSRCRIMVRNRFSS
jgi:hypothetical protein